MCVCVCVRLFKDYSGTLPALDKSQSHWGVSHVDSFVLILIYIKLMLMFLLWVKSALLAVNEQIA